MNVNKTYYELGSKEHYKILMINVEVIIMYVTYHLKESFVILK